MGGRGLAKSRGVAFGALGLALTFVATGGVTGLSSTAVAAVATQSKREVEARADFAAGRYQKAVDTFAILFAETGDPVFLRNIGRCYQKMKRPAEAIDSFKEYLHKARELTAGERQEVEGYVSEMEALDAASRAPVKAPKVVEQTPPAANTPPASAQTPTASRPAPETPPPQPPTETSPASPAPSTPTGTEASASPAPQPRLAVQTVSEAAGLSSTNRSTNRSTWRKAGIVTGAVGVASIVVGAAFGLATRSASHEVSTQYDAATDSAGKRDATLQWVGYGVGAAAVATGVLMYLHGLEPTPAAEPASNLQGHLSIDSIDPRGDWALSVRGQF